MPTSTAVTRALDAYTRAVRHAHWQAGHGTHGDGLLALAQQEERNTRRRLLQAIADQTTPTPACALCESGDPNQHNHGN